MHKVAVLITGSPRFIEQGAAWWNLHLPKNIEFDLYGHCWNEHDHIGSLRYYNANFDIDESLFLRWNFKNLKITKHHFNFSVYDTAKKDPETHLNQYLFWEKRRDHILSVHEADQLMKKSQKEYDAVVMMRFDTVIKPGVLEKMIPFVCDFEKSSTNKFSIGHDKALYWGDDNPQIWCPWVQVRSGLPVMQDFIFMATWKDWNIFTGESLYNRYYQLLNKDYKLLDAINFVKSKYHPHVFWAGLAFYSNANYIGNSELESCVFRSERKNINNISYDDIVLEFDKHFNDLCKSYDEMGKIQGDI